MKQRIRRMPVLVLIAIVLCTGLQSASLTDTRVVCTDLGIPTAERYPAGSRSRCALDMILWEGDLYMGSGDYDANTGPADIWCYRVDQKQWEHSGSVPDEEVNRFCVLNGELVAPGIDPRQDWSLGNYYVLREDQWVLKRTIPGGIHTFDLVSFDGRLFAGLGVTEGHFPVACSEDGGDTFVSVPLYRDGAEIDTSRGDYIRVYDLFVFSNHLYAVLYYRDETGLDYDLYRYDDGVFVYDHQWYGKLGQIHYMYTVIGGKAVLGDTLFFTTGYLYATNDMHELTHIRFPSSETVYDLYLDGDRLYALCGIEREDGLYDVSVWVNDSGKPADFDEVFTIVCDVPPLSLACTGSTFYLGMGNGVGAHEKNGTVLRVECSE